jgi:hypothetical protein
MFDVCSTVDAFNYPRYFHGRKETTVFSIVSRDSNIIFNIVCMPGTREF